MNPKIRSFIEDIRDNYDCDTGAGGRHSRSCRCCEAKRMIEVEDQRNPDAMKKLSDWLTQADEVFAAHVSKAETQRALRTIGLHEMSEAEQAAWACLWKMGWLKDKARIEAES